MGLWEKARSARGMISPVSNAKNQVKIVNAKILKISLMPTVHQTDRLAGGVLPRDGLAACAAREKPGRPW